MNFLWPWLLVPSFLFPTTWVEHALTELKASRQPIPILVYHQFSSEMSDRMTVHIEAFEEQMRFLAENGYESVTLEQALNHLQLGWPIPERPVVITIDDGWASTYHLAIPILKRYGLSATLFVYTDFPGQSEQALTWNMIRELQAEGFEIECHTKSHRDLGKLLPDETPSQFRQSLDQELQIPLQTFQKELGRSCRYVAYPYGSFNAEVLASVRRQGYRAGLTVRRGHASAQQDWFQIRRSMIYGTFDLDEFRANLTRPHREP